MNKFSKSNFRLIIKEIEEMEEKDENIWVPIGILEYMYEDAYGYLDEYFHKEIKDRDINALWKNLNPTTTISMKKEDNFNYTNPYNVITIPCTWDSTKQPPKDVFGNPIPY